MARKILRGFENTAGMLKHPESGASALTSLSKLLKKNATLNKVEPVGLETWSLTLQRRLQVAKAIENRKAFL